MSGEWKWDAAFAAPFVLPAVLIVGVGWCLLRQASHDRHMEELDEAFAVWEQIDRELMITGTRLREDNEVANLEEIPHGEAWSYPDGWLDAA